MSSAANFLFFILNSRRRRGGFFTFRLEKIKAKARKQSALGVVDVVA